MYANMALPEGASMTSSPTREHLVQNLYYYLVNIISDTNGISLENTLDLLLTTPELDEKNWLRSPILEFRDLLSAFKVSQITIDPLLTHPVADAFFLFFKNFPIPFREEHIHLTGSLSAEFIYPRLKKLLEGPDRELYEKKITDVYGPEAIPIKSVQDVDRLLRLRDNEGFDRYLKVLLLPKLLLTSREAHREASYNLAKELYSDYNVGAIRLKFTLSRSTSDELEKIPGADDVTPEDVVMGLYDGFMDFKQQQPHFEFILAPSFRKEPNFYDSSRFNSKAEHFNAQVKSILELIEKHPELRSHLREVDTVGSERDLYRKQHFNEMKVGFRKLQSRGFGVRSHHGETWHTLRQGVQAVDNAMNIWQVDAIEHGLSLGINPNFYYHAVYQKIVRQNESGQPLDPKSIEYKELAAMDWTKHPEVLEKLISGKALNEKEKVNFIKTKFHEARETELYQHDILNRMIDKQVSLIALPSSNKRLTGQFEDYKDHPFSWWEKKNMKLGVGTDNYITLNTNYIRELLILLFTDPTYLKITKLLIVATGENRRAYMSQLLWDMRKNLKPPRESHI